MSARSPWQNKRLLELTLYFATRYAVGNISPLRKNMGQMSFYTYRLGVLRKSSIFMWNLRSSITKAAGRLASII